MLTANHDITIGAYRLAGLVNLSIVRSTEQLAGTAEINLPSGALNLPYALEDRVKRGDPVRIRLGYDGHLQDEFIGYVRSIHPDAPMRLVCEDAIYLTRKLIADKSFKKTTAKAVLQYVVDQLNTQVSAEQQITLETDLEGMALDSFTIVRATGYEVLEKIKEQTHCALYMRGQVLHYHLAYTQKTGECTYDFARNIEEGSDLEYMRKEDRRLLIKVIGRSKKHNVEVEVGEKGGDSLTIHRPNVSDKKMLEIIGKELLKKRSYDGYRGSIKGWLWPYCEPGYTVNLRDPQYTQRAGAYYCTATRVDFGPDTGGRRTVSLSIKLG